MLRLFPTEVSKRSLDNSLREAVSQQAFSPEQRKILLGIAHDAILQAVNPAYRALWSDPSSLPPELLEPRGAFTTLYLEGQLRGCVGYAIPIAPLHRAVAETARAAAFDDSRFEPVSAAEVPRLQISLSVLSPLFPIEAMAVEIGRHGLVIGSGGCRGLLLPQVPVEHGWDRETFLAQTCRKAGLPLDAWRKGANIEAFTAEVFADEGHGPHA
jgi:uncharacterized protein